MKKVKKRKSPSPREGESRTEKQWHTKLQA